MVYIIRKFDPEKHHRQSCRIKGYDYSQPGSYFITIKTSMNQPAFGFIKDKSMILNNNGFIVYNEWINTSLMRPNIVLGEFIIMPDHVHGILIIQNPDSIQPVENDERIQHRGTMQNGDKIQHRGTMHRAPMLDYDPITNYDPMTKYDPMSDENPILNNNSMMRPSNMYYNGHQLFSFSSKPVISNFKWHLEGKSEEFGKPTTNSIPSIIRGFKSTVTKQINDSNGTPGKEVWQRSYYLRIIETQNEYYRTSIYIKENPQNSDI